MLVRLRLSIRDLALRHAGAGASPARDQGPPSLQVSGLGLSRLPPDNTLGLKGSLQHFMMGSLCKERGAVVQPQLQQDGMGLARCTVELLMRLEGLLSIMQRPQTQHGSR